MRQPHTTPPPPHTRLIPPHPTPPHPTPPHPTPPLPPRLLAASSRLLEQDAADCTANMALLDAVYLRAGLRPRLPSAQAMALAARSAEADAAAAAAAAAAGSDGQLTVRGS